MAIPVHAGQPETLISLFQLFFHGLPDFQASLFFCTFFGTLFGYQFIRGLKSEALTWGCLAGCLGYVGRIMLYHNPWCGNDIQNVFLIMAPAFIAAGIYLNLNYIVLETGTSFSRLHPIYYTWILIFILCDILSLVLQGAGGGIAATATLAGIVWQVFALVVFVFFLTDYARIMETTHWKLIGNLTLPFFTVFIRGWRNSVIQDQTDFIVLDIINLYIIAVLV